MSVNYPKQEKICFQDQATGSLSFSKLVRRQKSNSALVFSIVSRELPYFSIYSTHHWLLILFILWVENFRTEHVSKVNMQTSVCRRKN